MIRVRWLPICCLLPALLAGCGERKTTDEIVVYCGVDEPYASQVFSDFEKQSGIHIAAQYDIESSKSVGLAGKLEAEKENPRADVWWGSEAFLSVRLADEDVLLPYTSPNAADINKQFKDAAGRWTGVGLRARVLAIGVPPPPFPVKSIEDLADPRLKDKVCMSRPTAGATGAHVAALYSVWGPEKAAAFFKKLHDNGVSLLGGNAESADQTGAGVFSVGLTDSDDVTNAQSNGGKLTVVVPDQDNDLGTLAMPTTVGLVKGTQHSASSQKLIDYLVSKQVEQKLIDLHFARWSVRAGMGDTIKAMPVDYAAAAAIYPRAQSEATAILEGRSP